MQLIHRHHRAVRSSRLPCAASRAAAVAALLTTTLAATLVATLVACGGGKGPTGNTTDNPFGITATGPGVLSVSPIDTHFVIATTPLGKLGPPAHTIPTDHVYISFVDSFNGNALNNDCSKRAIYAAGTGVVDFTVLGDPVRGDTKVSVQMTKSFHYYYDHILPLPGIVYGAHVTAGQQIGTTTGFCPSFDLGAYDTDVTLPGLVNPARYGDGTRHAVSPYKYFTPTLRAFYLSRSRVYEGVPTDPDRRTDYGVSGRLIGDWWLASVPVDNNSSGSADGNIKAIAFAPDWYDGRPRVSIGGVIATPFYAGLGANAPDPATVSVASGLVAYDLTLPGAFEDYGWLLVQMTAADRIRIEFFAQAKSKPAAFTSAAQDYVR